MEHVSVDQLPIALKQTLSRYVFVLSEEVNTASAEAMKALVSLTKRTAPRREGTKGTYHRYIDSRPIPGFVGYSAYQWYVKAPYYRLTHLLEDSHRIVSHGKDVGARTAGTHFLKKATKPVFASYEARLQQIIEGAGK